MIGLTRSLALELAPSQIRVNCVAPGVIETDMLEALGDEVKAMLVEQTPLDGWARRRISLMPSHSWLRNGPLSSQDRYWEPRAGSLSEVTPRRKSADSVRAFLHFPRQGKRVYHHPSHTDQAPAAIRHQQNVCVRPGPV